MHSYFPSGAKCLVTSLHNHLLTQDPVNMLDPIRECFGSIMASMWPGCVGIVHARFNFLYQIQFCSSKDGLDHIV